MANKKKNHQTPRARNLIREAVPFQEEAPPVQRGQFPPSLDKYVKLADIALAKKPKDS